MCACRAQLTCAFRQYSASAPAVTVLEDVEGAEHDKASTLGPKLVESVSRDIESIESGAGHKTEGSSSINDRV